MNYEQARQLATLWQEREHPATTITRIHERMDAIETLLLSLTREVEYIRDNYARKAGRKPNAKA